MAGAVLTSLLKRLHIWTLRASSSSSSEPPSSAEQELHSLENTMRMIHAILEDAEEKDISDESVQLHLRELKEVACDAEDVVDEYEYEVLHAKVEARRWATASHMSNKHNKVMFDWNSYHPKVSISNELAGRIKGIRKRFEEIDDWNRIGLSLWEQCGKRRRIKKWKPQETTSYFDEAKTYGREDEKNEIIKWLLQEEEGDAVSVMGIVGMGGLGKTTLAQMAYNDTRVEECFNLRGWVHVSEEFDVAGLVKKIWYSFNSNTNHIGELRSIDPMSLDDLHLKMKVMLDGKRFFLVLDDVWNQKIELWSSLKTFLVGVGEGKILVTTRNERVAAIMQTTPTMNLGHLSFDDSWLLFKMIAYKGKDQNYSEIGKEIVNKCQGLPLAIKVLAGILRMEDDEEVWVNVLKSETWELDEEGDDDIFPVLKLSYNYLPKELKQCFMYLCLFPKGSKLDRSNIVRQWVSNGFIQSKEEEMEEDVGNDYCNEFLHRSILQYYSAGSSPNELRMHDLIHDLAQYVAKDEYLLLINLKSHYMIPKTIRHLSIRIENGFEIENLEPPLGEAKHLRTLMLSGDSGIPNIVDQLSNLGSLRTLVLDKWIYSALPDSIDRLKHLRYLHIHHAKSVPASVYNLHFLQTLASEKHPSGIKLSGDVRDLINLRHLSWYDRSYRLPREVAGLTNLQTLPCITLGVGASDDSGKWFQMKDLKGLTNLRGFFYLRGLGNVTWPDIDTREAYLKDKRGIKELALRWGSDAQEEELAGDVDERLAAQVLDSLQPHRHLETLNISDYPGVVLPAWLGHELPALKTLRIVDTGRVKSLVLPAMEMEKKSEPSHGLQFCRRTDDDDDDDVDIKRRRCFPSLEFLVLGDMNGLEEWRQQGAEEDPDFLRCLRELYIYGCPKLRTLPSLSHLGLLKMIACPELRALPSSLSRLNELWIEACPELRRLPPLPSLTKLVLLRGSSPELLSGGCCCSNLPMLRILNMRSYKGGSLIFPNDGSLDSLEVLSIKFCSQLRSVEGLGGLPSLRHLTINFCPLVRMSPDQRPPPNLQHVEMIKSPGVEEWYQNQKFPPFRR